MRQRDGTVVVDEALEASLMSLLIEQRTAMQKERYPSAGVRKDRLRRAINALIHNERKIVDACAADYGNRPEALSLLTEVLGPVQALRYALKNVDRWMKPERRRPEFPMALIGGRAAIHYQPLGTIGVMAPWNVPVGLSYTPLGGILAAGNLALIKPSEMVPQVSSVIAQITREAFDPTEVAVVEGSVEVSEAFSALPFDHLLFTGGAGVARHVMRAAAKRLVPVTLELGGKSPAIVAPSANLAYAARKIAFGKLLNSGQVCMAPDFALVPDAMLGAFTQEVLAAMSRHYPSISGNPDFTHVYLPRQRHRLAEMVKEAVARGAQAHILGGVLLEQIEIADPFPPVVVTHVPVDCSLMSQEIFGPVLPVVGYRTLEEIPDWLERLGRPLAMYFIGGTAQEKKFIAQNTYAGGMSFDDVMLHPFMQDLPFGGVGESGMGRYLGREGFKTFSNAKAVAQRPWIDVTRYLQPPIHPGAASALRKILKKMSY